MPFFLKILLMWGLATTAGASTNVTQCLQSAAQYHGVNPHLLRAVLTVESGLNPHAVGKNTNGTVDLGLGQINSMHLPELQRYGVTQTHLFDPCRASYIAAWFLRRGLDRYGYSWYGAATYHSTTPVHNQRYQNLLKNEMARRGISLNSTLTVSSPILLSSN
jgi:soluble lytic murein transglycosylase-like protein